MLCLSLLLLLPLGTQALCLSAHPLLVSSGVALVPCENPSRPSSLTQLTADERFPGWHYLKGTHLPLFGPGVLLFHKAN